MTEYYDTLTDEEKDEIRDIIQMLFRQTFLLERKYDRRAGRMTIVREYRTADRHLEFLKEYFAVAGIALRQNVHMGVIYMSGGSTLGREAAQTGDNLSSCAEAAL